MDTIGPEAAKVFVKTSKSPANANLALKVACWLANRGFGCALTETDDGVCIINYAANHGEGKLQPPIRVEGKLVFPKGTDLDLMMSLICDI